MDEDPPKTLIVFYDCNIPKKQFEKITIPAAPFALHFFVRNIFPDAVCNSDPALFRAIDELQIRQFPKHACIFFTYDQKFSGQVNKETAFNTTVKVITLVPTATSRDNVERAVAAARKIFEEHQAVYTANAREIFEMHLANLKRQYVKK